MSITYSRAAEVLGMAVSFNGCGRTDNDELKEAVNTAVLVLRQKAGDPHTHGDHIRSMTDGELAILINGNVTCDLCIHGGVCTDPYNMSRCIAGVKAYLGQERKADDGQKA